MRLLRGNGMSEFTIDELCGIVDALTALDIENAFSIELRAKVISMIDDCNKPKFTQEQKDFICYQIGDWYLKWKGNITNGQHRLGIAKEELKVMICGYEMPNECEHDWRDALIQECFKCGEQKEY